MLLTKVTRISSNNRIPSSLHELEALILIRSDLNHVARNPYSSIF